MSCRRAKDDSQGGPTKYRPSLSRGSIALLQKAKADVGSLLRHRGGAKVAAAGGTESPWGSGSVSESFSGSSGGTNPVKARLSRDGSAGIPSRCGPTPRVVLTLTRGYFNLGFRGYQGQRPRSWLPALTSLVLSRVCDNMSAFKHYKHNAATKTEMAAASSRILRVRPPERTGKAQMAKEAVGMVGRTARHNGDHYVHPICSVHGRLQTGCPASRSGSGLRSSCGSDRGMPTFAAAYATRSASRVVPFPLPLCCLRPRPPALRAGQSSIVPSPTHALLAVTIPSVRNWSWSYAWSLCTGF